MKVRVRDFGRYIGVDVAADDCPARECFWISERSYTHGGIHTCRKCEPCCGRREQAGCPPRRDGEVARWSKSRGVWKVIQTAEAKKGPGLPFK